MFKSEEDLRRKGEQAMRSWINDWNKFVHEVLGANLDKDQQAIIESVQFNPRTTVASGTARGKDFVTACAAICFLYLTPRWNAKKELVANTKVALTAPTDRQVKNIMMPEISRLYNAAKRRGVHLPGRLNVYDIRMEDPEWFLTGFKADEHQHEAWSGFHAVNTMFAITEASGISDDTFGAIEGNLQGNSRILLVFNPNTTVGYAAKSQKGERWSKFRLSSLTAPNVVEKRQVIPGQVDYGWVIDKIQNWCSPIRIDEIREEEDDFEFEGVWYRPTDIFRIKVLGKFPKVGQDTLIPEQWIEAAEERWKEYFQTHPSDYFEDPLILGSDIAGMGRDSSVDCHRYGNIILKFYEADSAGVANHMESAGRIAHELSRSPDFIASIDTIGEGAGVYSRLDELGYEDQIINCKYSHAAKDENENTLKDITGIYEFANMRAYLFWAVRDWLDPKNKTGAMLPPNSKLKEEATEIKWKFQSNGSVIIEPKEDIQKRLGRSTDHFDALANTFYPISKHRAAADLSGYF